MEVRRAFHRIKRATHQGSVTKADGKDEAEANSETALHVVEEHARYFHYFLAVDKTQ